MWVIPSSVHQDHPSYTSQSREEAAEQQDVGEGGPGRE